MGNGLGLTFINLIALIGYIVTFKVFKDNVAREYLEEIDRLKFENEEIKSDNRRLIQELLEITREKKEQE